MVYFTSSYISQMLVPATRHTKLFFLFNTSAKDLRHVTRYAGMFPFAIQVLVCFCYYCTKCHNIDAIYNKYVNKLQQML